MVPYDRGKDLLIQKNSGTCNTIRNTSAPTTSAKGAITADLTISVKYHDPIAGPNFNQTDKYSKDKPISSFLKLITIINPHIIIHQQGSGVRR